jgi:hypothetical protein
MIRDDFAMDHPTKDCFGRRSVCLLNKLAAIAPSCLSQAL